VAFGREFRSPAVSRQRADRVLALTAMLLVVGTTVFAQDVMVGT